jgi:hypothetical protein
MEKGLQENGPSVEGLYAIAEKFAGADYPKTLKHQKQRAQERLYLDFMAVRRWLTVTTSARALAAAGVV